MIMRRVRNAALVCGMGAARTWIVSTTGILKMMVRKMTEDSVKNDNKKCKGSSISFAGNDIFGGIVEIISTICGWVAAYFDELP